MGRGRGRRHASHPGHRQAAGERERLERRWYRRLIQRPELAPLVTGQQLTEEPFHRWLPYKQAFAPALVRLFLKEAAGSSGPDETRPLLDPFCGVGTMPVECARRNVPAAGVEALPVLVFIARAKGERELPPLPDLTSAESWEEMAGRLEHPLHRAALICAVAARHTSDGRVDRGARPLIEELEAALHRMRADLATPLPRPVEVQQGDARRLDEFATGSVAAVLTSPPYLSPYDYTRVTRPLEQVYRVWYGGPDLRAQRRGQVRAHPKAHATAWKGELPAAVHEAVAELRGGGQAKLAGVVRSYFEDTAAALHQMRRVLCPGGPCWLVVGGARLRGTYVPADLILGEMAAEAGFEVVGVQVARRLIPAGRKLGALTDVAPREVVLQLIARGD